MKELKEIDVISLAKVQAAIMAVFGFILGLFQAIIGGIFGAAEGMGGMAAGLGFLAIIVSPIVAAIAGFVQGAIIAFVYNLIADWIGGIEIDLE